VEKFGKNPNEAPRKHNLPLREALLAAGVLFSGAAEAQTAVESQTLIPRVVRTERIIPAAEKAERSLAEIQKKLAPGGEYYETLHDDALTHERFNSIVEDLSRTGALLAKLQSKQIPTTKKLGMYFRDSKRFPGQRAFNFHTPAGQPKPCNGAYVQDKEVYFVTARHCLSGTLEEKDFFFSNDIGSPDIAIREVQNDQDQDAIVLDPKMSDKDMHGQVGIIDTIDRFGKNVAFHAIYVKMTEPVERILQVPKDRPEVVRGVHSGMWYVAPPQQGVQKDQIYNFQGESGNLNFVWSTKNKGYVAGGILTAGRVECKNNDTHTCTTAEFMTGVDAIHDIIHAYRVKKTTEGSVATGSFREELR
jgi:hypothetical protein